MTKKVDYTMEILHKIISVLTVLACVAGLAWSCTNDGDITAHAGELDSLTSIFAYENEFRENLITANRAANDALNDSSLSDESKAKIRAVLALQELALRTMPDIYGNPTNPILPDSDTVTFSGSGASGVYRSGKDGNLHNLYATIGRSNPAFSSDEFSLSWDITNIASDSYCTNDLRSGSSERYDYIFHYKPLGSHTITFPSSSFFTAPYTQTYNWSSDNFVNVSVSLVVSNGSPPTVYQNANWSNYVGKIGAFTIAGRAVNVSLPEATTDTESPWDYYNDTLLPYMHNNYPDVTNNYYVFPNGYGGPSQDPTEPPLPNGGINVYNDWNFNIGFNTIIVTDASGQPVTDASGETVTETVIETETRPTDAVYHFQIPTLTPLDTQTATIPPYQVPSEYAGYMSNMFTAITDFIDDAGLTDVAPVFLALAGIGIVIGVLL